MRNPLYIRQLKRDLKKWVNDGLIGPDDALDMLESAGVGGPARSLPVIFAILGTVLLGFAAISYIAANFWAIPRTALLGLFIGLMCLAYGSGAILLLRGQQGLGQAATLLGTILFGANIMLIAQIYHISAHYPDGVMLWALGALLTAVLVPSRPALGLAFVLGGIWTFLETTEFDISFHWQFIAFWLAAFTLTHVLHWRPGFHLGVITLALWLFLNVAELGDHLDWTELQFFALAALFWFFIWGQAVTTTAIGYQYGIAMLRYGQLFFLLSFFILTLDLSNEAIEPGTLWPTLTYGLAGASFVLALINWRMEAFKIIDIGAVLLIGITLLYAPALLQTEPIPVQWAYSAIYLVTCIWMVSFGARHDDTFTINWSLVAFGCEILYIYFETFDSLLSQSGFFAAGGVLLILVSLLLDRLRRRLLKKETAQNEEEAFA